MSLTIASGWSFRYASRPLFADSATSTLAPHSSSIARMTSRVSSSSSTTSTVVPSSSMGDGCTPPGAPAIWGIFFRRPGYARRNEDALTRSLAPPPRFRCRKGSGILFAKAPGRRCSMKAFVVLLTVAFVLVAHVVAVAGPGDPRLVNGVLERPRTVTNEPFLVVRGDDGVLYYVGIAASRRDGPHAARAKVGPRAGRRAARAAGHPARNDCHARRRRAEHGNPRARAAGRGCSLGRRRGAHGGEAAGRGGDRRASHAARVRGRRSPL